MSLLDSFSQLTPGYSLEQVAIGYVMGVLIGMTGIGAGILAMPAMIYFARLDPVVAIGTSMVFSVLSRGVGVFHHWKLGFIDKETNFFFSLGAVPLVLLASIWINNLKATMPPGALDLYLKIGITAVLFLIAAYLLWDAFKKNQSAEYKCGDPLTATQRAEGTALGAVVGTMVGATSIGGGILITPILIGVFKLSSKCVVGTSNIIAVSLTIVGSGVYVFHGNANIAVAALVTVGSIAGVKLGADYAKKFSNLTLKRIIAGLTLVSFISMFASLLLR
ncbi:MAG: sulfite exporter TauE/SafE family protein [Nitrospinae bacterium]|nr:sulfite exporter TauE/SafE family protein [Nitrospinota bacterium]